jgi:hypothetical protein
MADALRWTAPEEFAAQGSLTSRFATSQSSGVLVPYVYGEFRRQFRDSSRNSNSTYVNDVTGQTAFTLPTDDPTRHYHIVGGGGSIVLKHGLQGFAQYVRVLNYSNYRDHVVSGGFRWEL